VQVPNLVGKTEDAARSALAKAGLIVKEPPGSRCSDAVDVGQVAKQGTSVGKLVPKNTAVSFDLANSPCTVDVRSVRSLPVDQAIGLLEAETIAARNIKVTNQTVADQSLDGIVIDQDIEGTNVKPFTVTLTVGKFDQGSATPAAPPS
jgi:beta-lactam-binding protein with PASTA domain